MDQELTVISTEMPWESAFVGRFQAMQPQLSFNPAPKISVRLVNMCYIRNISTLHVYDVKFATELIVCFKRMEYQRDAQKEQHDRGAGGSLPSKCTRLGRGLRFSKSEITPPFITTITFFMRSEVKLDLT